MTNYLIVLSKGRAGGGDGLQGEKRRGEQKGECLETLRFISSLLAPRGGLQGWVPLYVSLSPRRPPSLLFGSRWHLLLAWRVLPPPSEAGVPPTHIPACLPVQMLQSLGPACVESVRPVWCVMKRNRASHSGAQGAQGVEGWGWVPGKIGVGERGGTGRKGCWDTSHYNINQGPGTAQGLECPCTWGQKPREEGDRKEERGGNEEGRGG